MSNRLSTDKLAQLVADAKARLAEKAAQQASQAQVGHGPSAVPIPSASTTAPTTTATQAQTLNTVLTTKLVATPVQGPLAFNTEQQEAIDTAVAGKSFCFIGPAGSGKTTATREIITRVQRASHCLPFPGPSKMLAKGAPGIVICGFTNKAVNNIRKGLPLSLQSHCMTIHKLIEFGPVWYETTGEDGQPTNTMRFEPLRNRLNKLPHISVLIVEESSMVGLDLWADLMAALPFPERTQVIMLGDLNQIPPVFGPSILGFKLAEWQTIELTQVYRQALLSPIINLATTIRTNNSFKLPRNLQDVVTEDHGEHGKLTIHPWKQRVPHETAIHFMRKFLPTMIDTGVYDPEEDQILCPFNKSFGTIELNKIIADHLAKKRGSLVWEVIARGMKTYWSVGDWVLFDRHDAKIIDIKQTSGYVGRIPQNESVTLDRWGRDPNGVAVPQLTALQMLNALETAEEAGGEKNLASHTIRIYIPDLDKEEELNTAGAINALIFRYVLTIHKSQGSEWRKVFLFLHNSHSTMMSRELLYTGITRAREELYIICEGDNKGKPNTLLQGAGRAVIPGTTLKEKIAYFSQLAKQMVSKLAQTNGGNTKENDDDDF